MPRNGVAKTQLRNSMGSKKHAADAIDLGLPR